MWGQAWQAGYGRLGSPLAAWRYKEAATAPLWAVPHLIVVQHSARHVGAGNDLDHDVVRTKPDCWEVVAHAATAVAPV